MPVLLRLRQGTHGYVVFFEPAGNSIGVAPLILGIAVDTGNFDGAELFFYVLLYEPLFVLIKRFGS